MGRYCNDYYEKFPEAIKLKCGYDLDYIIKYVLCKKNKQLQLQVSNICHVNKIFRTRCLSPMYCVNLAETSQVHTLIGLLLMCVLNIRLYEIIVCSCINNIFSQYNRNNF